MRFVTDFIIMDFQCTLTTLSVGYTYSFPFLFLLALFSSCLFPCFLALTFFEPILLPFFTFPFHVFLLSTSFTFSISTQLAELLLRPSTVFTPYSLLVSRPTCV